jgi:hypothetical protein
MLGRLRLRRASKHGLLVRRLRHTTPAVHAILVDAVKQACAYNNRQDLSGVRIGAHDEIFQNGQPVLVGADVDSTYC